MKKQQYLAVSLLALGLLMGAGNAMAQKDSLKLKQEVEVVKAYQPSILDAQKINDIPQIKPEQTEAPTFDYSIFSKPVFSTFDPTPVAAAKMVGDPKEPMGLGLLKLGFGNYLTPYGELFFNAQPTKKSNFGMHFSHLSSSGKVKLLNEDLVKAPESENTAEIFGKKFFRKSTLSGSLAFDRKAFTYYGYAGDRLSDALKEEMIPHYQDKQYFSKGSATVHLKSETLSTAELNYDFGAKYHYFISKTGQTEHEVVLSGDVSKNIDNALGLLSASLTVYKADSIMNRFYSEFGKKQQTILRANPSVMWSTENASLQLGLNTAMILDIDTDADFKIWPKVKAEWSPVPQVLTLFAGVDGHLQHNTYSSIAAENPYADPYHDVANTNYKYIVSGGFKGKLTSKTNYVAEASWSAIEKQHFYITQGSQIYNQSSTYRRLNNTFDWVYDDVNILRLSAEVMHSVSDNFSVHLLGNYYSYDLKTQQKAWQMPNFDITISGIYKPMEQLKFTTDIFVIGSRSALIRDFSNLSLFSSAIISDNEIQLDPIIDLNVGAEYQFSPKLNFFAKLNNFGFQKYEQWLGYTNKGLNWMAGISYSF
ncbi:TonB-dependent receptor [Aquipluma nitroreducens]|uniref:TonB-dependent receptor n=1 Tax=Aquipluma nitroreducens TaxID=2010828 RepID=A0A5K7S6A9_9BACT|nr:hypothetical protein [Aquipluma nitroreducens]BBE17078.1 TonB-dependent receptor [Aquipluma nitroreducens]